MPWSLATSQAPHPNLRLILSLRSSQHLHSSRELETAAFSAHRIGLRLLERLHEAALSDCYSLFSLPLMFLAGHDAMSNVEFMP